MLGYNSVDAEFIASCRYVGAEEGAYQAHVSGEGAVVCTRRGRSVQKPAFLIKFLGNQCGIELENSGQVNM